MYRNGAHIKESEHAAFDQLSVLGTATTNAGIYRCVTCGDEIGIAKGHIFPLSVRAALHVAVMKRRGVERIMSFDTEFDKVSWIERVS